MCSSGEDEAVIDPQVAVPVDPALVTLSCSTPIGEGRWWSSSVGGKVVLSNYGSTRCVGMRTERKQAGGGSAFNRSQISREISRNRDSGAVADFQQNF